MPIAAGLLLLVSALTTVAGKAPPAGVLEVLLLHHGIPEDTCLVVSVGLLCFAPWCSMELDVPSSCARAVSHMRPQHSRLSSCCPADPFIAPVDIPTPRIYPKQNSTIDDFGAVNMTAMAPAQRAALAKKTITKAVSMVANITNPPPSPVVTLSSSPAAAAAPVPAVTTPSDAEKTAVSVCLFHPKAVPSNLNLCPGYHLQSGHCCCSSAQRTAGCSIKFLPMNAMGPVLAKGFLSTHAMLCCAARLTCGCPARA